MDWKLELVMVPVADMDGAKDFYAGKLGWKLISDFSAGEDFRVIQVLPPGSACAIAMMRNPAAAGSVQGLHLVVSDIEAARAELVSRGVAASELFHFADGAQVAGAHPERGDYGTYLSFTDPEGTGWMVQEVGHRG